MSFIPHLPSCPMCATRSNHLWGVRAGHSIYECDNCAVVFFPRDQFTLHDYQGYYEYVDEWDTARVEWELKIRRRALGAQMRQLASYVEGRELLDVGAGPGYLCKIAEEAGWNALGVEVSDKSVRIGREFLSVDYIGLEDVPSQSKDVITLHHVLEHVEKPDEFIKTLRALLKPGGVIAVHVPHREPFFFFLLNKLMSQEKRCELYVPEHISGFTQDSLVKSFSLFGFDPIYVRTASMWGKYHDPFFLKNYLRSKDYKGMAKKVVRSLVDNVGVPFKRGSWVIGYFRNTKATLSSSDKK